MTAVPEDTSLLDSIRSEYFPRLTGITNPDLIEGMLAIPPLRSLLMARISQVLSAPENLPDGEGQALQRLLAMDLDELQRVARLISVLVHAPSLARSTDGAILRLVTTHAGTRQIAQHLTDSDGPEFQSLPHTVFITQEVLDLYTKQIMHYLIGLVPPSLLQRMILRFPEGAMPAPYSLADCPEDREILIQMLGTALPLADEIAAQAVAENGGTDAKG